MHYVYLLESEGEPKRKYTGSPRYLKARLGVWSEMFAAVLLTLAATASARPATPWRSGEVLELSGEVQTGGLTGPLVRRIEIGSGRLFEVQDLGIAVIRNGFDGSVAWSQDRSGGVHDLNSLFARRVAVSMAWLDGSQGAAPSELQTLTRLGSRSEGGRNFAAWKAAPPGGVPFELWYDDSTGRLDRAFFQFAESRLIRHFADWRSIDGDHFVAFLQRDEFPEDKDELVRRITHATLRTAAVPADFARPSPPKDAVITGRGVTSVTFQDDGRTRVYLPVTLNGKGPFLFELDTGGHNIMTTETAAALGLQQTGAFTSTGAGNAIAQSGITRVERIRIGDALLTNQVIQVRHLSADSNDRSPRPPRAGILGLELFERFVVAVDPQAKTVTLSTFDSNERPATTAIPVVFTEDAPLIPGSYAGHAGEFMLDTGNAGPTIIEDYWARPLGLTEGLINGVARGDAHVSVGTVGLGAFVLRDELVSYYGAAERGSEYTRAVAGVYGEPLLSRFKSTYDYSAGKVWLEPLPGVSPLPYDRSGLSLAKAQEQFNVSAVVPGSPADVIGIRKDDIVSAVQGVPSSALSRADVTAMLRQKVGTSITLAGLFSGVKGSKTLTLRELLRR